MDIRFARGFIKKSLDSIGKITSKQSSFDTYCQDGLITYHNHDFMKDDAFTQAYNYAEAKVKPDYKWHWRVHTGLWAAKYAEKLDGDFVECGVNRGFLSLAIMRYIDWNSLRRQFYLIDTFSGLAEEHLSDEEKAMGKMEFSNRNYGKDDYLEETKSNFSDFRNICFVRGIVPEILNKISTKKVAYLSIDMNNAAPEIAAADFFWDKLVKGAIILLDDYAYFGGETEKKAFDDFASRKKVPILSLPTGQGILIKP